jgi:hypothetical protein
MSNWAGTASELATGAGTLVLAVATFAAVRSANRSAALTEESMRASMRPVLMHSRFGDPVQKFAYGDGKWVVVPGGSAAVEATEGAVYLAISVRNAGTGMAILHGWRVAPGRPSATDPAPSVDQFTAQTRDMYVASGDVGFWQGALRDPQQDLFGTVAAEVAGRGQLLVDLLYGDFEGGQRVISRFNVTWRDPGHQDRPGPGPGLDDGGAGSPHDGPDDRRDDRGDAPAGRWLASVVRHWNVDRPDPR